MHKLYRITWIQKNLQSVFSGVARILGLGGLSPKPSWGFGALNYWMGSIHFWVGWTPKNTPWLRHSQFSVSMQVKIVFIRTLDHYTSKADNDVQKYAILDSVNAYRLFYSLIHSILYSLTNCTKFQFHFWPLLSWNDLGVLMLKWGFISTVRRECGFKSNEFSRFNRQSNGANPINRSDYMIQRTKFHAS